MSSHIPRCDSWPPTQMRLHPSIEASDDLVPDLDLSFIDDDPLNFFLTPAPSSQDSEMDLDLDLGAGISTPRRKAPVVRSVSPSSLGTGLTSLPLRPPTPPRSFGSHSPEPDDLDMAPTPEGDEEQESYLRLFGGSSPLTPPPFEMPFSLKDFADLRAKSAGRAKGKGQAGGAGGAATLLSPASLPVPAGRGRMSRRPGPRPLGALDARGRTKSWSSSSARLSPRAWREPSPDVWSIEEETEEDVANSEAGDGSSGMEEGTTRAVDIPKVKKRVRFVLPVREVV
ncbi:hypothetical protein NKR19_g9990 [Coniochaeta hoffmannii]|uniref:Uncharacterized protein n=1 Tax=Coniochaeta hoffmannii TaxID=91930 RepID=A0AA38VIQ6_9PEZI|nr:hypothetical protein NKR19_g9990 [Coniochaeta hoffmannii]